MQYANDYKILQYKKKQPTARRTVASDSDMDFFFTPPTTHSHTSNNENKKLKQMTKWIQMKERQKKENKKAHTHSSTCQFAEQLMVRLIHS